MEILHLVQSLLFLDLKPLASHLLWLYSPVVSDLTGASKDMLSPDVAHSF